MPDKTLEFRQVFAALDPERITRSDFMGAFNVVKAYLEQSQGASKEELRSATKLLASSFNELRNKIESQAADTKDALSKSEKDFLKRAETKLQELESKIDAVKDGVDGMDADEEKIVQDVLAKIKLPEYRAPIMDGPQEIATKLDLLQDDEQLLIIKRILQEIAALKVRPTGGMSPSGPMLYVGSAKKGRANDINLKAGSNMTVTHSTVNGVQTVTFASTGGAGSSAWSTPAEAVDGSTTVFTVDAEPTDVNADGVQLFDGQGYVYAALQITFTNAPQAYVRYR